MIYHLTNLLTVRLYLEIPPKIVSKGQHYFTLDGDVLMNVFGRYFVVAHSIGYASFIVKDNSLSVDDTGDNHKERAPHKADKAASNLTLNLSNVTLNISPNVTTKNRSANVPQYIIREPLSYIAVEASNRSGAIIHYDTITNITCAPASGHLFPIGPTMVKCIAKDKSGNNNTSSFEVSSTG